jgi:hypothetical protein
VAHTCNPSYSGGRDQEDHGSKPAQANSSQDLISKINHHKKKRLVEWLKVQALSSNPGTRHTQKIVAGAGGVAQAVMHLPIRCVPGPEFNPRTTQILKKKTK